MAKCPVCGKIWSCGKEDIGRYTDEKYIHCRICRCPDCREKGVKEELDNFKYYHLMCEVTDIYNEWYWYNNKTAKQTFKKLKDFFEKN